MNRILINAGHSRLISPTSRSHNNNVQLLRRLLNRSQNRRDGICGASDLGDPLDHQRRIIGNREIVGFGFNGNPTYYDTALLPFPAIRYRECTPELMAIREKERGDWRKLSTDEKKYLYRASFRQTFAEIDAPSTEWKLIVGGLLILISISFFVHIFIHHYVYTNAPASFSTENRIAQYYRQVDINAQPITGVYRPPGAELRVHPKNKKMLEEIKAKNSSNDSETTSSISNSRQY